MTQPLTKCDHCGELAEETTNVNLDGAPLNLCDVCYYELKGRNEEYEARQGDEPKP